MNALKLLSFACVLIAAAGAHVTDEPPGITVTGTAVTQAKPDLLKWNVTVSNRGAELAAVSNQHTAYTTQMLRALRELGVRPEDLQTSSMQFSENREYRGNSWVRDGYIASTQVAFTLQDLSAYKQFWTTLAALNGVAVDSVAWDVSNRIALQNSTRLEALKAAKAKASQMAAGLGVAVGEPVSIAEDLQNETWLVQRSMNSVQTAGGQGQQTDDSIAPGTIPIRIRVRVTFRIGH